jgi:hypothetical protein
MNLGGPVLLLKENHNLLFFLEENGYNAVFE